MSRISDAFERARQENRAALVGYLTAYDPDPQRSLAQMIAACESGLDIIEVGVPFSDPTADGPAVQGAMVRALQAGATVRGVLELVTKLRAAVPTPVVLFSYANPLLAMGPQTLVQQAQAAGVDGLLVVDLPPEVAAPVRDPARAAGLDWIGLVAPTTTPQRMGLITEGCSGFVYAITLAGVTGSTLDTERPELAQQLQRIASVTDLPIAAGFGVSTAAQARSLAGRAHGVVVGSALIRAAQQGTEALRARVAELAAAMRGVK